jgi:hypothetical protein
VDLLEPITSGFVMFCPFSEPLKLMLTQAESNEVNAVRSPLALFGSAVVPDVSPECAPKRTSAGHSEFMGSHLKDFSEVAREELRAFTTL